MTDFKSKYGPWALVAGASEGLGAAFAEEIAKRGVNLILIARRLDKLELLANKLQNQYKIEVRYQSLDLSDFQQVRSYIAQLDIAIGLLVYNAAYAPIGYFEDIMAVFTVFLAAHSFNIFFAQVLLHEITALVTGIVHGTMLVFIKL